MNENENENELGHSHRSLHLSIAGDGPEEVARQVREIIERSGHYVPSDGFIRLNDHRTIGEANEAIYSRGEKGEICISVGEGLTTFRGGDVLDMSDCLEGLGKLTCYLCDRKLDLQYCYIAEKIKEFLPLNYHHLCCFCERWISYPKGIKNVIAEHKAPIILVVSEHTSSTVNIFHLIRYLNTIDQHKANGVRKRFIECNIPLNPKILRDFYK